MIANIARVATVFIWFIVGFVWPDVYGILWQLIQAYPLITWEAITIACFVIGVLTWCFVYLVTRPGYWWGGTYEERTRTVEEWVDEL